MSKAAPADLVRGGFSGARAERRSCGWAALSSYVKT